MQNIFALNGLAGGNTGLGGIGGLGMFGGGGLNGGIYGGGAWGGSSIQPNEMCAPVNVAKATVNKYFLCFNSHAVERDSEGILLNFSNFPGKIFKPKL